MPVSPSEKMRVQLTIADLPVDFEGWEIIKEREQLGGITTLAKITTLIFVCHEVIHI